MAAARTGIDPSDPYEREAQTFPVLGEQHVARMMPYGREEAVAKGDVLYARGQRNVDFFVVLAGSIDVLDTDERGTQEVFTTHHARQFTGELDLFNEREILVTGRVGEDGRVLRISRANFRRMVSTEADIGEIIMRAFILRRVGLIRHSHGGVTLIGSGMRPTRSACSVSSSATPIPTACSTSTPIRTRAAFSTVSRLRRTSCRW